MAFFYRQSLNECGPCAVELWYAVRDSLLINSELRPMIDQLPALEQGAPSRRDMSFHRRASHSQSVVETTVGNLLNAHSTILHQHII